MRYFSTRDRQRERGVPISVAMAQGAAPDGGLYLPETIPRDLAEPATDETYAQTACRVLAPYFAADPLCDLLPEITREAFDFAVPLSRINGRLQVLELFHGPTAAFKDFGARFLASCLQRSGSDKPRTVLVATSGDTGGAVAGAFHDRPGFNVIILFPSQRVSPLQQRQLTCWGANVRSFEVLGTFDDCQRLVKEAFANRDLAESLGLTSANSINIGRLFPQIVYYFHAASQVVKNGGPAAGFLVPSGNVGNATACVLAKLMGARIGPIVLSCNANQTVPEFFAKGIYEARPSVATLASAMDVGAPGNLERLEKLLADHDTLSRSVRAVSVSDVQIAQTIRKAEAQGGHAWCPHTATALYAFEAMSNKERQERPWVAVATAHPGKFAEVLEPLIGRAIKLPVTLDTLFERPVSSERLAPAMADLEAALIV